MRIELRDGQWAELRERITHGQDKALKKLAVRAQDDGDRGDYFDWQTEMARSFTRSWNVRDPDGEPITLTDHDAIERAPDDIVDVIAEKAVDLYTPATVPNPSTPPSSDDSSSTSK